MITLTDITESRRTAQMLLEAQAQQAASLEQLVEKRTAQLRSAVFALSQAEERERQAMAMELHDDLGQMLALIALKLNPLLDDQHEAPAPVMKQVVELVRQANAKVRTLAFQLSPPVLYELGLPAGLEWLRDEMRRSYQLDVELHDDGLAKPLDVDLRTIAFRAVRELLINVAKHAGTASARVECRRVGARIEIVVGDNGAGFDASVALNGSLPPAGFGLVSNRERLRFIGGGLEIRSVPGDGTEAVITVPLEKAAPAQGQSV